MSGEVGRLGIHDGFLVERADVFEGCGEEFGFGFGEVAEGFGFEHLEGVEDGFGGAEVDIGLAGSGVRDAAEEEPCVLRLKEDELAEAWVGYRRVGHGWNRRIVGGDCPTQKSRSRRLEMQTAAKFSCIGRAGSIASRRSANSSHSCPRRRPVF